MNVIVTISADKKVNSIIQETFSKKFPGQFLLQFPETENNILELLNFELPEIVIVNFTDAGIDLNSLRKKILNDSWLHNFGIIGIFDKNNSKEKEILEEYKDINLLTLLEIRNISGYLDKTLDIISKNKQFIYQRWLSEKLINQISGTFVIKNSDFLVVPVYSGLLAMSMVRMGRIGSEDRYNLQLALTELIINGIEHGNCGITYEEKTSYLMQGYGMHELIQEKNKDPQIALKNVRLDWDFQDNETLFTVSDDGKGFDVEYYLKKLKSEDKSDKLHGRGITLARMVSDKIIYGKKGNSVRCIIKNKKSIEKKTPLGFSGEEVIRLQKGDVLMSSGEFADCLYYISSGKFTVFHKETPVGKISPADIFMGEMAFLLSNTRSATVIAETAAKVIKIPRKSFISVVKQFPQYSIFISKLLAQKLVRANENSIYQK